MGRFDFQSPGANMVGALRKFLVDREEQERKRFLDDITATREQRLGENAQAATEVARENALSLKDARESTGKLREQQIAKAELDTFTGQHLPGDEVSNADAAKFPGVVKAGSVTQGAHLGTDEAGVDQYEVAEKKPEFQGTGDQRKVEAEKQQMQMYINSLPPGPQKDFLTAQHMTGDKTLPASLYDDSKKGSIQPGSFAEYVDAPPDRRKQIEKDRKSYGQADDRAFAPRLIITPEGQQFVRPDAGQKFDLPPTTESRNREFATGRSQVVLDSISELSEKINVGSGLMAKATGMAERAAAKVNYDDDVAEYQALVSGFTPLIARAVGHTGVLTEQDVQSVKAMFPAPGDSKTLRDRKVARINHIMMAIGGTSHPDSGGAPPAAAPTRKRYDMNGNEVK